MGPISTLQRSWPPQNKAWGFLGSPAPPVSPPLPSRPIPPLSNSTTSPLLLSQTELLVRIQLHLALWIFTLAFPLLRRLYHTQDFSLSIIPRGDHWDVPVLPPFPQWKGSCMPRCRVLQQCGELDSKHGFLLSLPQQPQTTSGKTNPPRITMFPTDAP